MTHNNLYKEKLAHINSLKVFNQNVYEIVVSSEYGVRFQVGTLELSLHILLPLEFPVVRPHIHVQPPVLHHTVSHSGAVAAPGLNNWSRHSELGRIVQGIIAEFEKIPPTVNSSITLATPHHSNIIPDIQLDELTNTSSKLSARRKKISWTTFMIFLLLRHY